MLRKALTTTSENGGISQKTRLVDNYCVEPGSARVGCRMRLSSMSSIENETHYMLTKKPLHSIDYLPAIKYYMPRRHAFRYVKIQVISTSLRFGVKFSNPTAYAVSSASEEDPPQLSFTKAGEWLSEEEKGKLRKIDEVALRTLRNCMHTVYEDGPRRDMRLWSVQSFLPHVRVAEHRDSAGLATCDCRLCARMLHSRITISPSDACTCLRDYHSMMRDCFVHAYMRSHFPSLAGTVSVSRRLPTISWIRANPPVVQSTMLCSLLSHYWTTSKRPEMSSVGGTCFPSLPNNSRSSRRTFPTICDIRSRNARWKREGKGGTSSTVRIFDGCVARDTDPLPIIGQPTLDKESSEHAIMIYCLKATQELADLLKVEAPSFALAGSRPESIPAIVDRLTTAHRKHYYDSEREVFVSGKDRQISWAANSWAVLAGIPESREQAAKAMQVTYESKESIVGMTPYLHHYVRATQIS